jgi:uncharacterized membrane protein
MHTLVKTAAVIHNLALATAFGGPLFARVGLRRAVIKEIPGEKERGRVLECAWTRFNKLNVPAHLLFTGTWIIERKAIMRLHVSHHTQRLIALKDVLIVGALATGLANVAAGKKLRREFPEGFPVRAEERSSDPKVEKYHRYFRVMGPLNLFFVGASLAIGPAIAGSIIHSSRRGLLARLFGR